MGRRGQPERSAARSWTVALLVAAVSAATLSGVAFAARQGGRPDRAAAQAEPNTAAIRRTTLARTVEVRGRLDFDAPQPLAVQGTGTITWLPAVGTVVQRGERLASVDDRPVVALYGPLPMFRDLGVGAKGNDVRQLEENLRALRMGRLDVDETFTSATADAVRRWQKKLGVEATGTVERTRVHYTPGPVRIAALLARPGAGLGGDVLSFTSTSKVVTVVAAARRLDWATPGTAVDVVLPGGDTAPGRVVQSLPEAAASPGSGPGSAGDAGAGGGAEPQTTVTAHLDDPRLAQRAAAGPVVVRHAAERRDGVLVVPVTALLALAEGGYGVELVEAGRRRVVGVQVGLIVDGRAEVTGDGLAPDARVVLP